VPSVMGFESVWAGAALALVTCALVTLGIRAVLYSPFGLAVDGVRDNEERFTFLGSKTVEIKLIVFTVSAGVAGLAGGLYAAEANFVSSELMGTLLSTEAVVWVAVGGRRTLVGAFAGALVVRGVGFWLGDVAINWWQILLGALFLAVVLGGSAGLAGLVGAAWRRSFGRAAADR